MGGLDSPKWMGSGLVHQRVHQRDECQHGVPRGGGLGARPQHTGTFFPRDREAGARLAWGWAGATGRGAPSERTKASQSLPLQAKEVWLFSSREGLSEFWGDICGALHSALGGPGWSEEPLRYGEARGPSHPTTPGGRADLREGSMEER